MAVFRVERTRDYTVMSNHHLKDTGLTLKAKGLLSMMLSLPDEWNYTTRGLAAICKEGVDAIGAALKELETAGYIIRTQLRDERGRISDTEYVIYEQPRPRPGTASPDTENPDMVEPDMDAPYLENPAQLNTKVFNTQKSITHGSNTHVTHSGEGEGLLFYGNVILPFVDKFPKGTELYRIMTTKPGETERTQKAALLIQEEML